MDTIGSRFRVLCAVLGLSLVPAGIRAEQIPARYVQGTEHGFLAVRNQAGAIVASGDLRQVARGGTVNSRLIFRFKDGSIAARSS
jgi:hypothetical protein